MSTGRATVVLALTPLSERQLEPLLFETSEQEPLVLLASVLLAAELQRIVERHKPDAVLLSPGLSGVSRAHCEQLRALGVSVIGIALDEREQSELAALGVEQTLDCTVTRAELLHAIRSKTQSAPAAMPATPTPSPIGEQRESDGSRGSVLAVIGSKGAPGASECAASLAGLAQGRWRVLLAELDAVGATLAVRLGKDAGGGSMLGLLRATTQADQGAVGELLQRWQVQHAGWPTVLLGAPDTQALCELAQPGTVGSALGTLAGIFPLVVCDVGFALADSLLPAARVHREALLSADAVLIVLGASETQLHHGLSQLTAIIGLGVPPARLRVALAGAAAQTDKAAVARTVAQRLAEHELALDALLPWDARAASRARRTGVPLALARRRGPYARAIKRLLDELFLPAGSGAAKTRARKRRLPVPHHHQPAEPRQADAQEEVALPWRT